MESNINKSGTDDVYNFSTDGVGRGSINGFNSNVGGVTDRESWSVMVQNLYHDMQGLWDRQSMLIRTEMSEKITDIKAASVTGGIGTVCMVAGLFSLVATAIICLNLIVPLWAAAVIVTALLFIVGGVMLATAKKKLAADKLKPVHSMEAMSEISTTLKERLYEFKH